MQDAVQDALGARADSVSEKLQALNEFGNTATVAATNSSTLQEAPVPPRTLCRPAFSDDKKPVNPDKIGQFCETLTQAEFESQKKSLGYFACDLLYAISSSCVQ